MILSRIQLLLEMIRFSHTLFAFPFALLSAVMAWTTPTADGQMMQFGWLQFIGIFCCMVFGRSASMSVNRIVDRDFDAANPRTAKRHLPAGLLPTRSVVIFAFLNSLAFVASTCLFLPNRLPLLLSVPVLLFLFGYSYAKRFTALVHFWLGAALMLAPLSTWIAIRGEPFLQNPTDLTPALLLGGAVLLWVTGFDIIYACQDTEFDRQANLHSVPAMLGNAAALRVATACHFGMVLLLAFLPLAISELGWVYYLGLLTVTVLLAYEHWIVRPDDLTRVNIAFFQINAIVSFGLFIVTSIDLCIQ